MDVRSRQNLSVMKRVVVDPASLMQGAGPAWEYTTDRKSKRSGVICGQAGSGGTQPPRIIEPDLVVDATPTLRNIIDLSFPVSSSR